MVGFLRKYILFSLFLTLFQGAPAHQDAHKICFVALPALATACGITLYNYLDYQKNIYWPWETIEASTSYPAKADVFPKDFIWGVATSSYQVEGNCTNSNYIPWEQGTFKDTYYCSMFGATREPAGIACDHWNCYKEDIQLIKKLGMNCYRFSLEWSKIEPQEGIFDQASLCHYADLCTELIHNGIRPIITFHHYSEPQWFADLGSFEHPKNGKIFARFCQTTFSHLTTACKRALTTQAHQQKKSLSTIKQQLKPFWISFNEPTSYAANGYLTGMRPPCKVNQMQQMIEVINNMLTTHVAIYQSLKATDPDACIGIIHNQYQVDPASWFNPFAHIKCYMAKKIVHTTIVNFFKTGTFSLYIPGKVSVHDYCENADSSLDFIGTNYYGHGLMGTFGGPYKSPHEIATDSPRNTIYAEGLYRAIKNLYDDIAQPLGIPILITENGIATTDPALRDQFLKRYLYALSQAIQDGYPVIGYIHWSLMDNYEWGNYDQKFGIFSIDRKTVDPKTGKLLLTRSLKPGSDYLITLLNNHQMQS